MFSINIHLNPLYLVEKKKWIKTQEIEFWIFIDFNPNHVLIKVLSRSLFFTCIYSIILQFFLKKVYLFFLGFHSSIPGSGKSLERKWQLPPAFLPGKSNKQRRLEGYAPRDHKESDMTYRLKKKKAIFIFLIVEIKDSKKTFKTKVRIYFNSTISYNHFEKYIWPHYFYIQDFF